MTNARVPQWTLADRLRKARRTAGLEQTDLAQELGLSLGTIKNYEAGRTEPKRPVLVMWALRCGVPPEWLAFGTEPAEAVIDTREQVMSPTKWYVDRRPRRTAERRPEYAPVIRIGRAA